MNYPSIRNLERAPEILCQSEILVTEKIHGMSWRILIPEGATSSERLRYGSRGSWATEDHPTLGAAVRACCEIFRSRRVPPELVREAGGLVVFGEIFGPSVQKVIRYLDLGFGFRVFDVWRHGGFLDWDDLVRTAGALDLPTVPVLYRGPPDPELLRRLVTEPSCVAPEKSGQPREGIVIRTPLEAVDSFGERMMAKFKVGRFADHESKGKPVDLETAAGEARLIGELAGFVSEARIVKGASILREGNRYRRSMADMPGLVEILWGELEKEDARILGEADREAARSYLARIAARRYESALRVDVLPPRKV